MYCIVSLKLILKQFICCSHGIDTIVQEIAQKVDQEHTATLIVRRSNVLEDTLRVVRRKNFNCAHQVMVIN